MQNYKMWIDGQWADAESGRTFAIINPATGQEFAYAPLGDKADVDKAVKAARKAFPIWSKKPQAERSKIVGQIAQALAERIEEFARIESLDHGSPLKQAINNTIPLAIHNLEYASQVSRAIMGDHAPITPNALTYIKREPIGVCAIITPWNLPLGVVASFMGMALAMGNTCVIKPPSIDCLSSLKFAEILEKMDLPPGTVNIISGPGGTAGEALASHPGINHIGFVGSSETGKAIMSRASSTVKRLCLELGGKNPFIILEDADIDAAVDSAAFASFLNCGMICASPGRYYVQDKVYDEFLDKFVAAAKKIKVGDPLDETSQMGPVVSQEHREKIEAFIKSGIEEGAKLVLGGKRPARAPLNKGYYVLPTIFADVTHNMRIAREEIFGPVAPVIKFKTQEEALRLANDSVFGLCASIWTRDVVKGIRFSDEINAGTVWVNDHMALLIELPWGGFKESGMGKSSSIYGIEEYTQLKVVHIDLSGLKNKPWHHL